MKQSSPRPSILPCFQTGIFKWLGHSCEPLEGDVPRFLQSPKDIRGGQAYRCSSRAALVMPCSKGMCAHV